MHSREVERDDGRFRDGPVKVYSGSVRLCTVRT